MEYLISFSVLLLFIISFIQQGCCADETAVVVNAGEDSGPPEKGVMCYVCNSKGDPNCGDKHWNPKLIKLVNCTDQLYMDDYGRELLKKQNKTQPNICRKQVQRISLGKRTDTRVIRSCGYMPQHKRYEDDEDYIGDDRCFTRAGTFEVMVTYCSCTKDECNAGSRFGMKPWIPLAIFFVLRHLPLGQPQ